MSPLSLTCGICIVCMLSVTVVHSCEVYADQAAADGCGLPGKLANFQGKISDRARVLIFAYRNATTPGNEALAWLLHRTLIICALGIVLLYTMSIALQGPSSATTTWWLESRALSQSCKRKFKPMTTSKRSVLAILGGSNSSAAARTAARSTSC